MNYNDGSKQHDISDQYNPQSPDLSPFVNPSNKKVFIVLGIVITIAVFGIGGYFWWAQKPVTPTSTVGTPQIVTNPTSLKPELWWSSSNGVLNFLIAYPKEWKSERRKVDDNFTEYHNATTSAESDVRLRITKIPCIQKTGDYILESDGFNRKIVCLDNYELIFAIKSRSQRTEEYKKLLDPIIESFYPTLDMELNSNLSPDAPKITIKSNQDHRITLTIQIDRSRLKTNDKIQLVRHPNLSTLLEYEKTGLVEGPSPFYAHRILEDLGEMVDDGNDGDEQSGDGIFSKVITLNEKGPLVLSYGILLIRKDVTRPIVISARQIFVTVDQDPEKFLNEYSADLRAGNREAAYQKMRRSDREKRVLDELDQATLNSLAEGIEKRKLSRTFKESRWYKYPFEDTDGTIRYSELWLYQDATGVWSIQSL